MTIYFFSSSVPILTNFNLKPVFCKLGNLNRMATSVDHGDIYRVQVLYRENVTLQCVSETNLA